MDFISPGLQSYSEQHSHPESPLLLEIAQYTQDCVPKPRMLSGHLQGCFLSMVSRMLTPSTILEIGTYTGYASLCLVEGLQLGGKLVTIDINHLLEKVVRAFFTRSGRSHQIEYLIGDARSIIPGLEYSWDLVFLDADKINYLLYYELVIPQLRSGGYVVADNVLWSGKVIQEESVDEDTEALREFNRKVQSDPRVRNFMLPFRDGLMIVEKI
ncbi:MAG: O-methyltransferase [Cytophagales bacterium]|nr:O-methyltransferase [Cytophagales bacterium]